MRGSLLRLLPCLLPWAVVACGPSTATGPCQPTPVDVACLAGPPTFLATVTQVTHEQGVSPAGPLDQYDLWIAIDPSTTANAGVVLGNSVPVFLRRGTSPPIPSTLSAIQPGDRIAAWVSPNTAYGSVEAPPGAPAYLGQQVEILR